MYRAIYGDGNIRDFNADDIAQAAKMANAYSGPILSVKRIDNQPEPEVVEPPEADIKSTNRMVLTGKKVRNRKEK